MCEFSGDQKRKVLPVPQNTFCEVFVHAVNTESVRVKV